MATTILQAFRQDKIGDLTESGGTISLGPSRLTIGGVQAHTDTTVNVTPSGLSADTFYRVYAILSSGAVQLVVSSNSNNIGPSGHNAWKLVGKFYSGLNSGINALVTTDNETGENVIKARAWLSASSSHNTSGSQETVPLDNTSYDTHNVVDLANNQIKIPKDGFYLIRAQVRWNGDSSTGSRSTFIDVNGTDESIQVVTATGQALTVKATTILELNEGDIVKMNAFQSSGGTIGYFEGEKDTYLEVISWPDSTNLIE